MRGKKFPIGLRAALAVLTVTLLVTSAWSATERTIHNFQRTDGAFPDAGPVSDAAGNLYGTAEDGGRFTSYGYTCGTVFEITP